MDMEAIRRRVDFLLREARSPNPQYCHAIQTMMRTVSNELIFQHWSSRHAKRKAQRMSREAFELNQRMAPKSFAAATINEHPVELRHVWEIIRAGAEHLSPEDVENLLKENCSPIVVTKLEDARLRQSKMRGMDRYKKAGIEVLKMQNGEWVVEERFNLSLGQAGSCD